MQPRLVRSLFVGTLATWLLGIVLNYLFGLFMTFAQFLEKAILVDTPTTLIIGAIAGLLHWRMLTTASTKWAAFVGITSYIGAWLILLSVPDFFFGTLINGQSLLEIRIRYFLTFTIASGLIAVILTLVIRQLMRLVAALRK